MSILYPIFLILPIPLFWLILWLRRRRGLSFRMGLALTAISLVGLIGGQIFALVSEPGSPADDGMDVRLPAPPEEAPDGAPEAWLVRFLTFRVTSEGDATLVAHATATASAGERIRLVTTVPGAGPVALDVTARPEGESGTWVEFYVGHDRGNHTGSRTRSRGETEPVSVDRIRSSAARPWSATFPWSRVSGPLTVLFVDPLPPGATPAIVPYRETWEGGERERARAALAGESGLVRRRSRGIEGILGALSPFAGLMLVLLCAGGLLAGRRAGAGLVLFALTAPLLLVGLDGVAVHFHTIRASRIPAAAVQAAQSVFFAETGQNTLQLFWKGGEGEKMAVPEAPAGLTRRNLLTAEEWNDFLR